MEKENWIIIGIITPFIITIIWALIKTYFSNQALIKSHDILRIELKNDILESRTTILANRDKNEKLIDDLTKEFRVDLANHTKNDDIRFEAISREFREFRDNMVELKTMVRLLVDGQIRANTVNKDRGASSNK